MKMLIMLSVLLSFKLFAGATSVPDKDSSGNIIMRIDPLYSESDYSFMGTGFVCSVAASTTTNCEHTIIYSEIRFNGISIITTGNTDNINLKVLDTATGEYSLQLTGTAVPNAELAQFAKSWNLTDKSKEILPYSTKLYQNMRVVIEYKNNDATVKNVYINLYFHLLN